MSFIPGFSEFFHGTLSVTAAHPPSPPHPAYWTGGVWGGASYFMKYILITLCNPQHSVITRLLCSSTKKLTEKATLSLQAET